MKQVLPVFNLRHFQPFQQELEFYTDDIRRHVALHHFTAGPHKHDFFLTVLFTRGSGRHEVDFNRYPIHPGSLFLLSPGQSHCWELSKDIGGIIFFHSRAFFDGSLTVQKLRDFPFFSSVYNPPLLNLTKAQLPPIQGIFEALLEEYKQEQTLKKQRLLSLTNLLYINLTRIYTPYVLAGTEQYLARLREFEDLLDEHFREIKFPAAYAEKMNITERHLNRITKTCLNKTPSALILDRNMLEAGRMLLQKQAVVSEVGAQLGYPDNSYFSRLFKKHNGKTPREFVNSYR